MDEARFRVFENVIQEAKTAYYLQYVQGADGPLTFSPSYVINRAYHAVSDVKHLNYHKRVRSGELIIGPLTSVREILTSGGGFASGQTTPQGGPGSIKASIWPIIGSLTQGASFIYNGVPPPTASCQVDQASAIQAAKLGAYGNVDGAGFQLMEDVLTMRQNLKSILNPLHDFRKITDKVMHRRADAALADLWLRYRMEARPLVKSIFDLAEGTSQLLRPLVAGVRLRATGRGEATAEAITTPTVGQLHFRCTSSKTFTAKAGVFYTVKCHVAASKQRTLGLRAKDLPAGLWAAMPYSFMIDRMVDVSSFLRGVSHIADPNIIVEGGYVTTCLIEQSTQQLTSCDGSPTWTNTYAGDVVRTTRKTITRVPFVPSLADAISCLPRVQLSGLANDASRAADLAALVLSRLR